LSNQLLEEILIEQYTIASETIELGKKIGMESAIKRGSAKFKIEPLDLALTVKIVLDFEVEEVKREAIL
jgi:hypothetical protein